MDYAEPRPRLVPQDNAMRQLGIRRTKLYALVDDGELKRVKCGSKSLITQESIDRYIDKLIAQAKAGGGTLERA